MRAITLIAAAAMIALVGCGKESANVKGKDGKELQLTAPGDTSLTQGETKEITVKVDREKFKGPIDVMIAELPDGVTVVEEQRQIVEGKSELNLTLKATPEAKPVEGHKAKVSAKAGEMKAGPLNFTVNVKPKG